VIVLDSSALVAIMRDEPETGRFIDAISTASLRLLSSVSYLETSMVLAGPKAKEAVWRPFDAFLARASVNVAAFDQEQALAAREAFLRFGKGRHPAGLNFGDCAAYALAKSRGAPLLFKGGDFLKTDIAPALA
jgi:ribonuclease VapC